MSFLISFERCKSSCEEHGTSEHYKNILSTVGFNPSTPASRLQVQTVLTNQPQLAWYEMELNAYQTYKYTIYKYTWKGACVYRINNLSISAL